MGFRLLLLIIALLAIWLIGRHLLLKRPASHKRNNSPALKTGQVLECHFCHVHVPEEESITQNGRFYCCSEHARQDNDPH